MTQWYAEELPYFETSSVSVDTYLDKATAELEKSGGKVTGRGNLMDTINGQPVEVIYLTFTLNQDGYRIAFPALQSKSKSNKTKAARIQAATMLYHDVKARSMSVRVLGARTAFGGYRLLPNGMTDGQISTPELATALLALPAPKSSIIVEG